MLKREENHGAYVTLTLNDLCLNGDAFVSEDSLYKKCRASRKTLSYETFKADLAEQIRRGFIHPEGSRIYSSETWRYEESAARSLSEILRAPKLSGVSTLSESLPDSSPLCEEQRAAVSMAVSNRLTLILGGAGCGKSTLISAIVDRTDSLFTSVLCAPTGKAARNLTDRTCLPARTVHSALGVCPDEDFLEPVVWDAINLVIVDEASMMTLGMLAGILQRTTPSCRVVLLGDPNQLLSVGSGNVLPDLLALGVPCSRLEVNHRQDNEAENLLQNVVGFSKLSAGKDLTMGNDFCFHPLSEDRIHQALTEDAVRRYLAGESVQVLSPYNRATKLSARALNSTIRNRVNPASKEKPTISYKGNTFRDGDRVMILQNDRVRRCCNGDVGILHILKADKVSSHFYVQLSGNRRPTWRENVDLELLTLAYAITVHKAQGSEYDTILFPVSMEMYNMLNRNLFYTAISRARKQVALYGSPQAVDVAIKRCSPPRKSMLVAKTWMCLAKCA